MAMLLTPKEVARQLNVSVRTLHEMRRMSYGPAWLRINRKTIRYVSDDVVTWIKGQKTKR